MEEYAAKADARGPGASIEAALKRWFTPLYLSQNHTTIERIKGWVMANDAAIYTQCRQVLAHGVIELIRPEPAITHPTLIMTCENDSGSTPAMSYAIASEIVGAKTVVVPALQHMGLVEQPALFTTPLLDFLQSSQP